MKQKTFLISYLFSILFSLFFYCITIIQSTNSPFSSFEYHQKVTNNSVCQQFQKAKRPYVICLVFVPIICIISDIQLLSIYDYCILVAPLTICRICSILVINVFLGSVCITNQLTKHTVGCSSSPILQIQIHSITTIWRICSRNQLPFFY